MELNLYSESSSDDDDSLKSSEEEEESEEPTTSPTPTSLSSSSIHRSTKRKTSPPPPPGTSSGSEGETQQTDSDSDTVYEAQPFDPPPLPKLHRLRDEPLEKPKRRKRKQENPKKELVAPLKKKRMKTFKVPEGVYISLTKKSKKKKGSYKKTK